MKMATKSARGYRLSYKKKSATRDPYLSKVARPNISVCGECNAVYMNKRWYADEDTCATAAMSPDSNKVVCPACLKIRDHSPGGIVTLQGSYVQTHKQALLNLIKNEEGRARGQNPLERVISITDSGYGSVVISTTNEKLAQRIGRAINKAFHGEVAYRWSHDTKLARVNWMRESD